MRARTMMSLLALAFLPGAALAIEITNVSHVPSAFDPAKQSVEIRFRLAEPARVVLRIFDGRELSIRAITTPKELLSGDQLLSWDGRDERGRPVPPEAYVYTLTATSADGRGAEYDLTDLSGDRELAPQIARWDPAASLIRYDLPSNARVKIRAGLANSGPLLRTVIDWVPRRAGSHAESWDGRDESGLIDASRNPDLQVVVQAWALPKNAIIVLPERPRVELIAKTDWPESRRAKKIDAPLRERALPQQPIERRSDVRIRLSTPEGLERDGAGVPIARGKLAIRLDVDPADRERLIEQRFEAGFFLDGKHVFENEVGFLPMTWVWDASAVNEGVHYVTGNVWGYAGQFGTTTIAIRVAPN